MFVRISLVFLIVTLCYCDSVNNKGPKLIIDNDAGADDAMAIFLALIYEKHYNGPKLLALTTGNGNTNEDNVCLNNQRILKVAGRQDIPIYRGSKSSLVTTPVVSDYFGHDGLGDSGDAYSDLVDAKEQTAVDALIEMSKTYEGELSVITIGALTNVALAIQLDPQFLGRLAHLYVGAGHIHNEDNPDAEFNAHMDVEAYHIVAQNATPDKVTVVPFSQVKTYLNYTKDWRQNIFGKIDTDIVKALNKYEKVSIEKEAQWQALDPATIALIVRPDLIQEHKYSQNGIILCGDNRGRNTNRFVEKEEANVRIIYSVKTEVYKNFLLDVFSLQP